MFDPYQRVSREKIEAYRRMSPSEKQAYLAKVNEEAWTALYSGTPEEVAHRLAEMKREGDLGNENMLRAIARLKRAEEAEPQGQV